MSTSTRKRRRGSAPAPAPVPAKPKARSRSRSRSEPWSIPLLDEWGLSRFQQRLVVVAGSVAGVLVATFGFILAVGAIGNGYVPEQATSSAIGGQPRPDTYKGWVSPKLFAPIARSEDDPKPLTLKDVFAEKTLKGDGITLQLAGTHLDADCAAAVWGQELVDLLAQGGCTQAARGVYASADGRYVAQYTLLNLRDTASADALVQELTTLHRGGWTQILEADKAPFPVGGHTEGSGHAMGHYAGLVWFGRADGADPGPKDDFLSLGLTVRGAEKAVFRRVVAADPEAVPAP
ncbi:hypothetical protein [Streptosporangium lutulentum]|uniref:Uncharacterized protein n=1 Tax=Streptosporangium lutulentum TaxID=1461250 RepID=A0ABT9QG74_9ACTN|nr:hypothetical protein [Streptosporangium lutulentum]MDP9845044.1 hypothetical protein [Streptosporangium lutulentum]